MRGGTLKLVNMQSENVGFSDTFNDIVETNWSSKRAKEGTIILCQLVV